MRTTIKIVILEVWKMKNANKAFDLQSRLAMKSVLEKLKLSCDMYHIPKFLQFVLAWKMFEMPNGYPGSSFLF